MSLRTRSRSLEERYQSMGLLHGEGRAFVGQYCPEVSPPLHLCPYPRQQLRSRPWFIFILCEDDICVP